MRRGEGGGSLLTNIVIYFFRKIMIQIGNYWCWTYSSVITRWELLIVVNYQSCFQLQKHTKPLESSVPDSLHIHIICKLILAFVEVIVERTSINLLDIKKENKSKRKKWKINRCIASVSKRDGEIPTQNMKFPLRYWDSPLHFIKSMQMLVLYYKVKCPSENNCCSTT